MTDVETLKRSFERALALAHAAVDEPTVEHIADAQELGREVLLLAARRRPAATTLADGHMLLAHASRLRALLALVDELEVAPVEYPLAATASAPSRAILR